MPRACALNLARQFGIRPSFDLLISIGRSPDAMLVTRPVAASQCTHRAIVATGLPFVPFTVEADASAAIASRSLA